MTTTSERLALLRAQRTAQLSELRADEVAEAEEREVKRLELEIADDERFVEIKRKESGSIVRVNTTHGMVVFRRPERGRWNEFQDTYDATGKNASQHAYQLVVDCRVYPSIDELDAILDKAPAMLTGFLTAIGVAAGEGSLSIVKK